MTTVPDQFYSGCYGLTEVVIPERITKINLLAFSHCSNLRTVVLNTGVSELGLQAFSGCTSLEKVFIDNPLTISAIAFNNCPSSTEFNIAISESEFEEYSDIYENNDYYFGGTHNYGKYFAVVLDPNGGEGAPHSYTKTADETFTVSSDSSAIPVREGFNFIGWNTKPDGSGKTYLPGDKYTENATLNLFAQWRESRIKRLAGSSRNGTAVAISKDVEKAFDGCKAVVLANGWDFADALAGGPLACALDASILLITDDDSDEATFAEIARLGVKDVYILGGKVAVGEAVQKRLENDGYNVNRIAGSTRFETAVKIAEEMDSLRSGKYSGTAFFAYSHNYPDALAISGIASTFNAPILYVNNEGVLDSATEAYVGRCSFDRAFILGGTGAISGAAEGNIEKAGASRADRIAGATRYETCLAINETIKLGAEGNNKISAICVSTGITSPTLLQAVCLRRQTTLRCCLSHPMSLSLTLSGIMSAIISNRTEKYLSSAVRSQSPRLLKKS